MSKPVISNSAANGWFARLPRPARRFAAKAPARLYDAGFGWLFGHRFLLLTHRGRRSGRDYRTMVEVILYDRASRAATVLSGTGPMADWYRNLQNSPSVQVQIGRDRFAATATLLDEQASREAVREFARLHPLEGRIASALGMDDKPAVVFRPVDERG